MASISKSTLLLNKLIEPLTWLERAVLINGALSPTAPFVTEIYIFVAVLITIAHAFVLIYNSERIRNKIANLVAIAQNNVNSLTDCKVIINELTIPYDSYVSYWLKRTICLSGDIGQRLSKLAHSLRVALHLGHNCLVIRPFV